MTTPVATPLRLQLSRRKGFDLQALSKALNGLECVNCARPGKWGNRFTVTTKLKPGTMLAAGMYVAVPTVEDAIECYRIFLADDPARVDDVKRDLRGKNISCWCPLCRKHQKKGKPLSFTCTECAPCHCDVLGEIANR